MREGILGKPPFFCYLACPDGVLVMPRRSPARGRYRTLNEYLVVTGQTQAEYAKQLGVSQALVSWMVRGKRPVSRKLARRIHADTGIPLEKLMQLKSEAGRGA